MDKVKTIYDLKLHEGVTVKSEFGGNIEITRVPDGWIYSFEYPVWRQSQIVFVKYHAEFINNKPKK